MTGALADLVIRTNALGHEALAEAAHLAKLVDQDQGDDVTRIRAALVVEALCNLSLAAGHLVATARAHERIAGAIGEVAAC